MQVTEPGIDALFREGRLDAAIAAANQAVRRAPGDAAARLVLAELLVFAGNLTRADVVLNVAAGLEPSTALVVAEFRQLLRAETARRQLWQDGRVPMFLGEPADMERALLAAIVALRHGDVADCAAQAEAAECARPAAPVLVDGVSHADFRDADDFCAGILEVLTTTGKYFWIPISRVVAINFYRPGRPRDLAWRRATLTVADGPEGDVYVPAIYAGTSDCSDALRLGYATDWSDTPPVRGVGQRVFLAGEDGIGIMDLAALRFAGHA